MIVAIVLLGVVSLTGLGFLAWSQHRALRRAQYTVRSATLRAEQHAQSVGRAEGFLRQAALTADPETRTALEIAINELQADHERLLDRGDHDR